MIPIDVTIRLSLAASFYKKQFEETNYILFKIRL